MGSPYMYGVGGADLSTVDPNPSIYGSSDMSTAQDISTVANTAGQWGATIASIVSGNPVATVGTPGGGVRTIGAAGSTYNAPGTVMGINSTTLLLVLGLGLVLFFVLKDE